MPVFKDLPRCWEEHRPQRQTSEHAACQRVMRAQKRDKAEYRDRGKRDRKSHFFNRVDREDVSDKVMFEQMSSWSEKANSKDTWEESIQAEKTVERP